MTEKPVSKDLIEPGSSFSIYPLNSESDVSFIIEKMGWEEKALIGNKTVREMLTSDIDILSEKLKLSKFHSEYDLQFLPDDLKNSPHLTFYDYANHPKKYEGIPYSIIEDDLPKIKPRHFSISNDPFIGSKLSTANEFRIVFTVHRFKSHE